MNPLYIPTLVSHTGLYADDHVVDGLQLGTSIVGTSKLANSTAHFYLNGDIVADSRKYYVRHYVGPPKENGLAYEITALMVGSQLPLFAPLLFEFAEIIIPKIWTSVISFKCGRKTESNDAIDSILELTKRHDEFNNKVHEGHLQDRQWLQEHIEQLTSSNRPALKDLSDPVGRSCSLQKLWANIDEPILVDEAIAEALRSDDAKVGDETTFKAILHAVNVDTGSGKAELLDFEGKLTSIKV